MKFPSSLSSNAAHSREGMENNKQIVLIPWGAL